MDQSPLHKAFRLHKNGALDAAMKLYAQVLTAQPQNLDAIRLLGIACAQSGDHDRAAQQFEKALELQPSSLELLFNLGKALVDGGRAQEAQKTLKAARELQPSSPDILIYLSIAHSETDEHQEALLTAQKAAESAPNRADVLVRVASALVDVDRFDPAISAAKRALSINPGLHSAWAVLARACKGKLRLEEAELAIRKACALAPEVFSYQENLVDILIELGQFEAAAEVLRHLTEQNSAYSLGYSRLAAIRRLDPVSAAFDQAISLAQNRELDDKTRAQAAFAVGTVLDQNSEFERAFEYFKLNCDLQGAPVPSAEESKVQVGKIIRAFSEETLSSFSKVIDPDPLPIFVVGMPRSGTTLTEKIISAHPKAFGAGELSLLGNLSRKIARDCGASYPECIRNIDRSVLVASAEVALTRLREFDPSAMRIIDKMPGNFYLIGLISILFPGATILHLNRDPLDIALSCYQANFARLEWSHSFEGLAQEFWKHKKLMEHWRAVLPGKIVDVSYEELVTNPHDEAQRIIAATGLEWDEACLRPEDQKGFVRTASTYQARQAINASSMGRWRNYEQALEPLRRMLERNGVL